MKLFIILVIGILAFGLVSAFYHEAEAEVNVNADAQASDSNNDSDSQTNQGIGADLSGQIAVKKAELKEGTYVGPLGQSLSVKILSSNLRELRSNGVSAQTELNITTERTNSETKFKAHLSNGKESEIKIMPDRASEIAILKIKIHACNPEDNCTIKLRETGNAKVAYEVKSQKQVRILGLFKAKMNVEANVDAGTGEVISAKVPWWAFLSANVN